MEPEQREESRNDTGIDLDPGDAVELLHVFADGEFLESAAETVGDLIAAVAEGLG